MILKIMIKSFLQGGGEPMLEPTYVMEVIEKIRKVNTCPIYVYTAKIDKVIEIVKILKKADGITVTLHEKNDYIDFLFLNSYLMHHREKYKTKSLRLNVFKEVNMNVDESVFPLWKIKNNIEWIKNCPLPKDEIFCRIGTR